MELVLHFSVSSFTSSHLEIIALVTITEKNTTLALGLVNI